MWDEAIANKAGEQYNRVSRQQLLDLDVPGWIIDRRIAAKRLVVTEQAVLAVAPVLDDPKGWWMGATLTADDTYLSHWSAAMAYTWLDRGPRWITVTRPGNGGPRRHGNVVVYRRLTLEGEVCRLLGIPITTPERTLLDLARHVSKKALARALRIAVRLGHTTLARVVEFLSTRMQRRGARNLLRCCAEHAGLPLEDARSGAEVEAMIVLGDAGYEIPILNKKFAGAEPDLRWPQYRLIVEVDGGPFHQDKGEDARKQALWEAAGDEVRRISSDDVYNHPERLLALVPEAAPATLRPSCST